MEESQRGFLREKLDSWERAAGAGLASSEGLNSESAFGELQLARPLHAYGFLPTLQRRLAVLRELGSAIAEEHRCGERDESITSILLKKGRQLWKPTPVSFLYELEDSSR